MEAALLWSAGLRWPRPPGPSRFPTPTTYIYAPNTKKKTKNGNLTVAKDECFPSKWELTSFLALLRSDQTKTVNTEPFPSVQMAQLQLYVLQRYDLDLICKWR